MSEFDKYKQKVLKRYKVKRFFKKFKVLLIVAGSVATVGVSTPLIMKGLPKEKATISNEITYGSLCEYTTPEALLGGDTGYFEVYNEATDKWEKIDADSFNAPGDYQVRYASVRAFGNITYSKAQTVTVEKKSSQVSINIDALSYGSMPTINNIDMELVGDDYIESAVFKFESYKADDSTGKVTCYVDLESENGIVIKNKKTGKVTTDNYVLTSIKKEILFNKKAISVFAVGESKTYDGKDYEIEEVIDYSKLSLSYDDEITDVEYHFEENGEVVETPKQIGTYKVVVTGVTIKNKAGEDVTGNYNISYNSSSDFKIASKKVAAPSECGELFIYDGTEKEYEIKNSTNYTIENNVQINAGTYTVKVSLNDPNYVWLGGANDGKNDPLTFTFVINKQAIAKPNEGVNTFEYTGSEITYVLDTENKPYTITNNVKTYSGTYEAKISLGDNASNYEWIDSAGNHSNDLTYTFTISSRIVSVPNKDNNEYFYNGNEQTYLIQESTLYTITNNTKQVEPGTYEIKVSLNNESYVWSDGTREDKTYEFVIKKGIVNAPVKDSTDFVYAGSEYTYNIEASSLYIISSNTKQTEAGSYTVTVTLADSTRYKWATSEEETLNYNFIISKKVVTIPEVIEKTLVYNSSELTLNIPTSSLYTITGNKATLVGNYEATIKLNSVNYVWSDNTTADRVIEYQIVKTLVEKPTEPNTTYYYTGTNQAYDIKGNEQYKVYKNTVSSSQDGSKVELKDVGTCHVIVHLVDPYSTWKDGTTEDLDFTFEIKKATLTVKANNSSIVYGSVESFNGVTYSGFVGEDNETSLSLSPSLSTTYHLYDSVGTYDIMVNSFTLDNYNISLEKGTLLVNPKEVELEWNSLSLVYNGSDQHPIATVKNSSVVNSDPIPTVTSYNSVGKKNVGTSYIISATIISDPNYKVKEDASSCTYSITKAPLTITANNNTVVYGNDIVDNGVIYSGFKGNDEGNVTINVHYSYTYNKYEDVGLYVGAISITVDELQNYEPNYVSGDLTVNKKVLSVQWNDLSFTYDGNSHKPTTNISGVLNSDDVVVTVLGEKTNAGGNYSATLELSGTKAPNYQLPTDGTEANVFTINKVQIEKPEADTTVFVYDGTLKTYNPVGFNDALMSVSNNTRSKAGAQDVQVSIKDTVNYEWSDGTQNAQGFIFTIEKAKIAKPEADTTLFVYNNDEKTYSLSFNDALFTISGNKETNAGNYTVTLAFKAEAKANYTWEDGTQLDQEYEFVISRKQVEIPTSGTNSFEYKAANYTYLPEGYDASLMSISGNVNKDYIEGGYTALVTLNDTTNYEWKDGVDTAKEFKYTITKKALIIKANDKEITYGDTPNNNGVSYTGFISPDNEGVLGVLTGSLTFSYTYVTNGDVGTYEIIPSGLTSNNYNITFVNGVLTVVQKEVGFVWSTPTIFDYDDLEHIITVTSITGLVDSSHDVTVGTYSIGAKKAQGTYDISVLTLAGSMAKNYKPSTVGSSFTITTGVVEKPTAVSKTYTYNGEAQTFELEKFNSDIMNITNNVQTNAGTYTVTVSLKDKTNYKWSDGTDDLSFTFTINKKNLSITANSPEAIIYGSDPTNNGVTTNGLAKEDALSDLGELSYTYSGYVKGTDVGTYSINVELINTTALYNNYNVTYNAGSLVVTQKELVITWSNLTHTFDNSSFLPTALFSEFLSDDDGLIGLSMNGSQTNAGKWVATITGITGSKSANYKLPSNISEEYTIEKAKVSAPIKDSRTFVYNGSSFEYTLDFSSTDSSLMTVSSNTIQSAANTYTITVTLKDTTNYEWTDSKFDGKYSFVIEKASITKPTEDLTVFTYNGSSQTYNPVGFNGSLMTKSNDARINYGSQEVAVSIANKANYKWADGTQDDIKFSFSIAKYQITKPTEDLTVFTYNGSSQTYNPVFNGIENTFVNINNATRTNANTYSGLDAVVVSIPDKTNYEWNDGTQEDISFEFTINQLEIVIGWSHTNDLVYNGQNQKPTVVVNNIVGGTPILTVTGEKKAAGSSYTATVTECNDPNYKLPSVVTTTFSISQKEVEIVWTNTLLTYNGTNQKPTANFSADKGIVIGDDCTITVSGEQKNAGSYSGVNAASATLNGADKDNYVIVSGATKEFTINKYQFNAPTDDTREFIYNGFNQTYQLTGSFDSAFMTISNNVQKDHASAAYKVRVELKSECLANYEWASPTFNTAGYIEYDFDIKQAVITITANDVDLVYGDSQKDNGVSYAGNFENINTLVDASSLAYAYGGYALGKPIGNYDITPSGITLINPDGNYTLTFVKGNISVSRRVVTILWSNTTQEYTGSDLIPTATVSNLVTSDICTIKVEGKQKEVGTYTVTAYELEGANSANYMLSATLSDNQSEFNITKKKVAVLTSDSTVFTYNTLEQTYNPVGFNASLMNITGNKRTNAGTQEVAVTLKDSSNYEWANSEFTGKFTFTINKAKVTNPVRNSITFIYDGTKQDFTTGLDNWNSVLMNISGNEMTDAGKYNVVVSLKDSSNYEWNTTPFTGEFELEIEKRELNISWNNTSLTYNTEAQKPSVSASNIISSDVAKVSLNVSGEKINAGTYTATLSTLTGDRASNYSIPTLNTTSYTINKKQVEIEWTHTDDLIYNGEEQYPTFVFKDGSVFVSDSDKCLLNIVSGKETNYGTSYTLTVELVGLNKDNYVIKTGDESKSYSINKKELVVTYKDTTIEYGDPIPTLSSDYVVISGVVIKDKDISLFDYSLALVSTTNYSLGSNVGKYKVTLSGLSLAIGDNYSFTYKETESLNVIRRKLSVSLSANHFTYTGSEVNLKEKSILSGVYGTDKVSIDKFDSISINVGGEYSSKVTKLTDSNNYEIDPEHNFVSYYIDYKEITKPTKLSYSVTYNAAEQTLSKLDEYEKAFINKYLIITNNKYIAHGTYTVYVSLNENCKWSGGTNETIEIEYIINKVSIPQPTQIGGVKYFTYSGEKYTYNMINGETVNNWDPRYMTISGNEATTAGDYYATIKIDKDNCKWSSYTESETEDISFQYIIANPVSIVFDSLKVDGTTSKEYTGSDIPFIVKDDALYIVTCGDDTKNYAKSVGTYTFTITLKPTAVWSDGYVGSKTLNCEITTRKLEKPTGYPGELDANGDPIYGEHKYVVNRYSNYSGCLTGYNSTYMTIGGVYKSNAIGSHMTTVTPKDGCSWSDGSTTTLSFEYIIIDPPTLTYNLTQKITSFQYRGNNAITPNIIIWNYNSSKMSYQIKDNNGDVVSNNICIPNLPGQYYTMEITLNSGYEWNDRVGDEKTKAVFDFTVTNRIVPVPTDNKDLPESNYTYEYNGGQISYVPSDLYNYTTDLYLGENGLQYYSSYYDSFVLIPSGTNIRKDPSKYYITLNLLDDYCEWAEDYTYFVDNADYLAHKQDSIVNRYYFVIKEKAIEVPSPSKTYNESLDLTYNPSSINNTYYPVTSGYNAYTFLDITITKDGITTKNVGESGSYIVTIKPKEGYGRWSNWSGHSLTDEYSEIVYEFEIKKAQIPLPTSTQQVQEYTYDGNAKVFELWNNTLYVPTGNIERVGSGTNTIIVMAPTNYEFTDHTTSITCELRINPRVLKALTSADMIVEYTYDGTEKIFNLSSWDNEWGTKLTTSSNLYMTNPGISVVTLNTIENYVYSDGTTSKDFTFKINNQHLPMPTNSQLNQSINYDGSSHTITLWDSVHSYIYSGNGGKNVGDYKYVVKTYTGYCFYDEDTSKEYSELNVNLTIEKISISVYVKSVTKEYDGSYLSFDVNNLEITGDGWDSSNKFVVGTLANTYGEVEATNTIVDASSVKAYIKTFTIYDSTGKIDITDNYEVNTGLTYDDLGKPKTSSLPKGCGTITITQKVITGVTIPSVVFTYDGNSHSVLDKYTIEEIDLMNDIQSYLLPGDTYSFDETSATKRTLAGVQKNNKINIIIVNSVGENVTSNYKVEYTPGSTITINKREVVVTLDSSITTFTSTPENSTYYTLGNGIINITGLLSNTTLKLKLFSANVADSANAFDYITIVASEVKVSKSDVSSNYSITLKYGTSSYPLS